MAPNRCGVCSNGLGHKFITLTVDICVQHGGPEALRCAGLSAAAETYHHRTWSHASNANQGQIQYLLVGDLMAWSYKYATAEGGSNIMGGVRSMISGKI